MSRASASQRAAVKRHYESNRPYYIAKAKRQRAAMRLRIRALKEGKPCSKCNGLFHFACLEWHHRDPRTKLFEIANAHRDGYGWPKILAEVQKCDLVCANCHAVIDYEAKNSPERI